MPRSPSPPPPSAPPSSEGPIVRGIDWLSPADIADVVHRGDGIVRLAVFSGAVRSAIVGKRILVNVKEALAYFPPKAKRRASR